MPLIGETPRQKQLKALANQFPIANQQVAQGQQAARTIQMQNLAKQAPGSAGLRQAQATGGEAAQQATQIAQKSATDTQNQQAIIGQAGMEEQGRQGREELAAANNNLQQQQIVKENQLSQLGSDVKQQLFDKQMSFKQDELGRTQFNDRQLMDYAILKAKNAQDFDKYKQAATQAYDRQAALVQQAMNVYTTGIQQHFEKSEQNLDQASKLRIGEALAAAQRSGTRKSNNAKNKAAAWQAGGTVVGTAVGAYVGSLYGSGTGGAMIGGALGGGIGSAVGGSEIGQKI